MNALVVSHESTPRFWVTCVVGLREEKRRVSLMHRPNDAKLQVVSCIFVAVGEGETEACEVKSRHTCTE